MALTAGRASQRRGQGALFIIGLGAVIAVQALWPLDLRLQLLILAPAVALLGVPHGALDLPMAQALWPLANGRAIWLFLGGYLGLAGLITALWWVAPAIGLTLFLAYSALHFSGDWRADGGLWRVAGGLSAVGAPALCAQADVAAIFAMLGPVAQATTIAQGTALAGGIGAGCAIWAARSAPRRFVSAPLCEIGAIWCGAALLPPLAYFAVYFCLLHAPRHLTETLAALPDRRRALRQMAAITGVTVAGAALALALMIARAHSDTTGALLQVVFIGLAALSVPHMGLVARFSRTGPLRRG